MITLEVFLLGLLITSTFTSLVTEAIKNLLAERNISYYANTLVAMVSVVLSTAISIGYMVVTGMACSMQTVVVAIALVILSWLCAMVGYDKVIQAICQINNPKKEGQINE